MAPARGGGMQALMFLRMASLASSSNWYRYSPTCKWRYFLPSSSMLTRLGTSPCPSRGNMVSLTSVSRPTSKDPDGAGAGGSSSFIVPNMVPGDCGREEQEQGSPEYVDAGGMPLPPPGEMRCSSSGWEEGPAPEASSGRAEGIYIESRQACLKAAASCCLEMAETVSASLARLCQWSWLRHMSASSSSRSAIRPLLPSRCMRDFRESSCAAMMEGVSRMRFKETCLWYLRHSGQRSQGSWTSSPVVVATHWVGGGESLCNVTQRHFLWYPSWEGDQWRQGRVSEPPSSCQSDNEPYPQGTWACQKVLWHVCDVQSVMGIRKGDGCGCQTWCGWWLWQRLW